jgi:hypothetical protein
MIWLLKRKCSGSRTTSLPIIFRKKWIKIAWLSYESGLPDFNAYCMSCGRWRRGLSLLWRLNTLHARRVWEDWKGMVLIIYELIVRTLEHPVCSPNRLCCCNSDDDRLSAAVDQIIRDEAKRKRIYTNTRAISHWECILDLLCNLYKQPSVAISWYCVLYNYICDGCFVDSLS